MNPECYPISTLPGTTALFRDFMEPSSSPDPAHLRRWYPSDPYTMQWASSSPVLQDEQRMRLADALATEASGFDAGPAALANIDSLRQGAAAVVTGQQVALFGGPLLTFLKAATAIRKAQDATLATGRRHVPIFWMASEDHDLPEADQVTFLSGTGERAGLETLRLELQPGHTVPVGTLRVDAGSASGLKNLESLLERTDELLGWAPLCDQLRQCYAPGATMASAFGRLLSRIFAAQGLVVMDAGSRSFHSMGGSVLRAALERADELRQALLKRSQELQAAGYHAQVLVTPDHSLLFLLDRESGARLPLRFSAKGEWRAGSKSYTTAELLEVLSAEPERLSPNSLLRPVFQDAILPTAAYVGGPAEVAYFAQSEVLYRYILDKVTPVLPRMMATLVEPAIARTLAAHELTLPQVLAAKTATDLAQHLGARAMPIEGKRRVAAVGNALETELRALTRYMASLSADLGRAADVSASKMLYQMNRLRRMAANFEVQKQSSLSKHAQALMLNLFPDGHLQERLIAGVWYLARYGEDLPALLIRHAAGECAGHQVVYL
ncbi:MAG: bacillithiol biosynthesis cysteine-adding enzyme BshC [Acidobacteriaceae bacterium]